MGWRKNSWCYRVRMRFIFTPCLLFKVVNIYSMNALREQTTKEDLELKKKIMAEGPQASYGYGGKFGVQEDR